MEPFSGDQTAAEPPHVVVFPTPGMGHLIPITELAKRLLPHFTFTLAIPTDGKPSAAQTALLSSLPAGVDAVLLPPVDLSDVPPAVKTLIFLIYARSLPALRRLFASYSAAGRRVAALVVDLFGTDAFEVAREFGVRPYIFFPTTAMALSSFFYMEELDKTTSCEYADAPEPIRIPGCIPIHGRDLPDPLQDRKSEAYKWILHQASKYKSAEGIMVNSFEALEEGPFKVLLKPEPGRPPVFSVGPLVRTGSGETHECLTWLGNQPGGSVLFVCFGSGGTLGREQLCELALGLESSNRRFLWVVKAPNDTIANAAYFSAGEGDDASRYLPEGFLERTEGVGMVMPNWAPQAEILSHPSTGGFLTHCGWNSASEGIVNGIPMILWPLHAEQRMNSVMLAEGLELGIKPSADEDGIIRREEVARVANELMGGEEGRHIKRRMAEMKDAASAALSENGSSTRGLGEIARRWTSHV